MKYVIDSSILENLAAAIRSVTGETRSFTPEEMIEAVTTIMETGTYILVDEDGNEYPAVFLENEVVLTATANDIRKGTTAVTENGFIEGTKEIPAYHTSEGFKVIADGSSFVLRLSDMYDYTKLQAIICPFGSSLTTSFAAEKVAINDSVYPVQSDVPEATIIVDYDNKLIDLGIINTSGKNYIIRYFTYKEVN